MSIKEFISNSLINFSNSISKVFVKKTDVVDNLTSTDTDKPLSANQGSTLSATDVSLQTQINTLNSNSSGIKKQLNVGESAYIYIDDGDWCGGIVLISVWRETANLRGIYMAQPGNGNNANQYQQSTVIALKELSSISVEAAVDSKYSSVKITNNHTSAVWIRAVALCGSQPEWIS